MHTTRFAGLMMLAIVGAGCRPSGGGGALPGASPSFDYESSTRGCASFTLYRSNPQRSEVFVVHADLDRLGISEGAREFDLASAPDKLSVTVEMYPGPQKHLRLCTDVFDPDSDKPIVWTAIRGTVRVERFPPVKEEPRAMPTFRVKVTVKDAEFRDPFGLAAKCPHTIVLDGWVGWLPG